MEIFTIINLILVVSGIIMIFTEVALGVDSLFDLVLSGVSLVIGGSLGLFAENAVVGLVVSIILVVGYWVLGRRTIRNRLQVIPHPTNSDRIVGQIVKVVSLNDRSQRFQVKFEGEVWSIESADQLEIGDKVKIVQGGTILKVNKV